MARATTAARRARRTATHYGSRLHPYRGRVGDGPTARRAEAGASATRSAPQRPASGSRTDDAARAPGAFRRAVLRPRLRQLPPPRARAPLSSARCRSAAGATSPQPRWAGWPAARSLARAAVPAPARRSAWERTGSRRPRRTDRLAPRRRGRVGRRGRTPSEEQLHADRSQEAREPERERPVGQALLESRACDCPEGGGNPHDCGLDGLEVAVGRVEDHALERDQADRGQRRGHRGALAEAHRDDEQRHHHDSAADAEERTEEAGGDADGDEPHRRIVRMVDAASLLARLAERPQAAAILLDVDGTLAPIVARPEDARVPDKTRDELQRLAGRYGLVACISGRPAKDAARIVGVQGIRYVGEHGLELEPEGEGYLREVAERALEDGLRPRWGRKVLEIRPPLDADKGTAVRRLLEEAALRRALYAGDDTTDLDAFRALDGLEVAVRVAVVSEEGPPGLGEQADLAVGDTEQLVELLRML